MNKIKMMIKMLARNRHRRGDELSNEKGAQCIRREITVGLNAWMWGWDGVGCMRQHGVGDNDCSNGWGLGNFLKFSGVGMGLGINCVGTGGDGDHLVTPCRPLQYNHHDQERIKISY